MTDAVMVAVIAGCSTLVSALVAGIVAWRTAAKVSASALEALKRQYKLQDTVEGLVFGLLSHDEWTQRSFKEIKKSVGGYDDDELRRVLLSVGAARFQGRNEEELWGLISRNQAEMSMKAKSMALA